MELDQSFLLSSVASFLNLRNVASLTCTCKNIHDVMMEIYPPNYSFRDENTMEVMVRHVVAGEDVLIHVSNTSFHHLLQTLRRTPDELLMSSLPIFVSVKDGAEWVRRSEGYKTIPRDELLFGFVDVCSTWGQWFHCNIVRMVGEECLFQYWDTDITETIHAKSPRLSPFFHHHHVVSPL